MNICRFEYEGAVRIGLVTDDALLDLTPFGISQLTPLLEHDDPVAQSTALAREQVSRVPFSEVSCSPLWSGRKSGPPASPICAARARGWRNPISAPRAYDRVYAAERPEIFFKSLPEKVVATGEPVGIRSDAKMERPGTGIRPGASNSRGRIVGYTIGNDMSSRDIEGENLLICPRRRPIAVPARWVRGLYWECQKPRCAIGPSILIFVATGTAVSLAKPPSAKSNAVSKNWPDFFFVARNFRTAPCCSPAQGSFRRTRSRWQRATKLPSQSVALGH